MRLVEIWKYPVKSMSGGTVGAAELDLLGIVGDRHWAVRSEEIGGIRGAKKLGSLMLLAAEEVPGEAGRRSVRILLPDGTVVSSDDSDANDRISVAIGHRVVLESLPADTESSLEHFRRGAPVGDDPMAELRGIFGREDGEPLPDFSVFPPVIAEFESPPGTHYDCWPLMVMTTQALRAMQSALPESVIDVRRFRPSLVIDAEGLDVGTTGHPEFSWKGRAVRVGGDDGPVIEFLDPCPRCVMTTREVNPGSYAPDTDLIGDVPFARDGVIPPDRAVLRHIVRDLDQNLGIYARIVRGGTVRAGDSVTFF